MDAWNTFSFPFGAWGPAWPIFRGNCLRVNGSISGGYLEVQTLVEESSKHMGVEPKNRGILPPKWMVYTLPETNSSHLNIDGWKMKFLFGEAYFQGRTVGFREGNEKPC